MCYSATMKANQLPAHNWFGNCPNTKLRMLQSKPFLLQITQGNSKGDVGDTSTAPLAVGSGRAKATQTVTRQNTSKTANSATARASRTPPSRFLLETCGRTTKMAWHTQALTGPRRCRSQLRRTCVIQKFCGLELESGMMFKVDS